MSTDGKFSPSQSRILEDAVADVSRKYEETKKKLDDSRLSYSVLTSTVETVKAEVTAVKIQRFKLESALREVRTVVSVLNQEKLKFESELEDKIKELEHQLRELYASRDSADRDVTSRAKDLAEEYRQYAKSCDKHVIGEQLSSLIAEEEALQREFEKLTVKISENSGATSSVELADNEGIRVTILPENCSDSVGETIDAIRQLADHVKKEISLEVERNEIAKAELSRLLEEKSRLEAEINKFEDVWG